MTVHNVGLDDALMSDDALTRLIARAGASEWTSMFQKWVNDEIARGEDPAHVLIGIMAIQIMTHSSAAANIIKPAGYQALVNHYKELLDRKWIPHAQTTRQILDEVLA